MITNDKPIPIIINPASGKPKPVLHTISETFRAHDLSWRGHITYKFGDATHFAQEAVADGAEMVVAFGGDGTVLDKTEDGLWEEGDMPWEFSSNEITAITCREANSQV